MRNVTIYVLFHNDVFVDVYASYSEAMLHKHLGDCCRIETKHRQEY